MRELTDLELNAISGGWGWSQDIDVDVDIDQSNYSRIGGKYAFGNIVQQANTANVLVGRFS
jgi:bacteriocin-like protein